jgi:hypothetical protein
MAGVSEEMLLLQAIHERAVHELNVEIKIVLHDMSSWMFAMIVRKRYSSV